jgi:hypothetical protein
MTRLTLGSGLCRDLEAVQDECPDLVIGGIDLGAVEGTASLDADQRLEPSGNLFQCLSIDRPLIRFHLFFIRNGYSGEHRFLLILTLEVCQ